MVDSEALSDGRLGQVMEIELDRPDNMDELSATNTPDHSESGTDDLDVEMTAKRETASVETDTERRGCLLQNNSWFLETSP